MKSVPLPSRLIFGQRDRSAFKSSKMEKLKLKKRNLKKGRLKEEKNHTQSPENDQICSGNEDNLKVIKKSKQGTAEAEARKKLMLKKQKRREEMFQGDFDSTRKKKGREEMSQGDPDGTKKEKRREKKIEGDFDSSILITKIELIPCKLKKAAKRETKDVREEKLVENRCYAEAETVEEISSVDEDCSRGMKKWVLDYHQRRPVLDIVQQRLDEFMAAYEAEQEQARKEREALAAEDGWTVVVHHKGRKKTTDSESGIAVGSVAQSAVEDKMAKKKQKELALDFYRFQKREAQRNEVMMLQSKFEQDKKRLQQLRAARKFRPY